LTESLTGLFEFLASPAFLAPAAILVAIASAVFARNQVVAARAAIDLQNRIYYTDLKRKHGESLLHVYKHWLNDRLVFSSTFEMIGHSVFEGRYGELTTARSATSSLDEIIEEWTYESSAAHHLMSGRHPLYVSSWNSEATFRLHQTKYEEVAKRVLPSIRNSLLDEIQKSVPKLREGIRHDWHEPSCNFELLVDLFLDHVLNGFDISFLGYDMESRSGVYELSIPSLMANMKGGLLLRTISRDDQRQLRAGFMTAVENKSIQPYVKELRAITDAAKDDIKHLQTGINGVTKRITLGDVIDGNCSICESWL